MKTKLLFNALVILVGVGQVNTGQAHTRKCDEDIEKYLDVATPSQFGCTNLRTFFSQPNHNLPSRAFHSNNEESAFDRSLYRYITNEYNKEDYAQRLSHDCSHVEDFLNIGAELELDTESMYTSLRLISNKLAWCEVVDYTAAEQTLSAFSRLLGPWLSPQEQQKTAIDTIVKEIDGLILSRFTSHLPQFHAAPDTFITQLAHDITQHAQKRIAPEHDTEYEQEMRQRLAATVKRTAERVMDKMMWNPYDWQSIMPSFISMGNHIIQLAEKKYLSHMDDLEDLLATLNTRLCYFLDIYGSVLPPALFDGFLADLDDNAIFFLEIPEQDHGVTPKKELLRRRLISAQTRAVARTRYGLQTDQLV